LGIPGIPCGAIPVILDRLKQRIVIEPGAVLMYEGFEVSSKAGDRSPFKTLECLCEEPSFHLDDPAELYTGLRKSGSAIQCLPLQQPKVDEPMAADEEGIADEGRQTLIG
jgi:hypothetical protein